MSDRLWGPGVRKWMGDARAHGLDLGFERRGRSQEFGGAGNPYTDRLTDDGGLRIIDSPSGIFGVQPRTVDTPG